MKEQHPPMAANTVPVQTTTGYPAPFADTVAGRHKRKLGEAFGLQRFGVNLTELQPGAASALAHHHALQDEFIYVLEGRLTLELDEARHPLVAGDCIGFPHGSGVAHRLVNESNAPARYLEMGDRTPLDEVAYPGEDLLARADAQGRWRFYHADGRPWEDDH